MKTTPFWWEDAPREKPQYINQPAKADVAIVGAGYSGLNAALVLARAGLSVVVFEAGQLGEGASTRNGGMVGPSFHKLGIEGLKAMYGETTTNAILRQSVGFVDYLEDFLKAEKIDADFVQRGRFLGALKPAHYDAMARQLEGLQKACNVSGYMVPKNEQASETGSTQFFGGVVYHLDAGLHPAKYHAGLAQRVRQAGAVILTNTPVQAVQKVNGRFNISTPLGQISTDRVAICTNAYTGPQFPQFRRRVLPLRSAIIATEPLPPEIMARLMPRSRVYGDSRRMVAYYRPSPDGQRILFGGRAAALRDTPAQNAKLLIRSMAKIYPELSNTPVSHVWSGLVAYTFDHAPHIGQHQGLDYAMGYCGSGVARSSFFGHKLGHKILGNKEKGRTAFDNLPFNTKPFYTGNPWFMPMVLNWHRVADRLGL